LFPDGSPSLSFTHRGHFTPIGCRGLNLFLKEHTMALAVLTPLSQTRFASGQVVMTIGVDALVRQGRFNPAPYLRRHLSGDWGDLDESDRRQNDAALRSGEDRLFSSYQVAPDLKLWIVTEWDRSVTTLLLPSEY
jgi:hypothetical protein